MRAPRRWLRRGAEAAPAAASPDADRRRLEALEQRVDQLEGSLEGLQDALYRLAVQHDKDVGELREQTKPEQIARDLSSDARRRGL